ncbi:malonate decarboxylase subunit epsilon [Pandoraea terrigena]|uniref:Malonyl CoA-acyl carrier protein transacylase n=1 Tax=Pandoraea terrigena TaxID=2508292 RepID=A0A5E4SGX3_9BURK|nr:malonate decarboxylase subunit epsilon [Pandoraea terrigena]VVD73428.1 Malonyl CoA-acyl carrier protein transacylase [Pandoraea terrigena]
MSVLFTYPGQGAQRAGMLGALPDTPEVESTLAEARDALGIDPMALCSAESLRSTTAVQLSLLIAGVAMTRALAAQGAAPDLVAGHSIGAWTAAVAAGTLDFRDALGLVHLRGRLMETAYPSGYGMTVVTGLSAVTVADIVQTVHADDSPAYVANLNAERQVVVAGSDAALRLVQALATKAGASQVVRLAMSVPSHCALLSAQASTLADATAKVRFQRPRMTYVSCCRARALFHPDDIAEDLAWNMARQVNWYDTARHAYERGARLAVEMPTGGVLTRLTRPIFGQDCAIDSANDKVSSTVTRILRCRRTDRA